MDGESSTAHENGKSKNAAEPSPVVDSKSTTIPDKPTRDRKNDTTEQPEWQRRQHRVQLRVQLATIVVAAIVAVIYGCQFNEMRKATQIAADNYRLQAKALHLDQRAWVGVETITGIPKVGEPLTVKTRIRNYGKSFAKDVFSEAVLETVLKGQEPNFAVEDRTAVVEIPEERISSGLLSPTAPFGIYRDFEHKRNITDEDVKKIISGDMTIFIHGKTFYGDIFGCQHWTMFCAYMTRDGVFAPYSSHNDADPDHCP